MISQRLVMAIFILTALQVEPDNSTSAEAAIKTYEKTLQSVEGFREAAVSRSSGTVKILIRVDSQRARDSIAILLGEKMAGYPLQIIISDTPLPGDKNTKPEEPSLTDRVVCTHCPIHCGHDSHATVVDPLPPPSPTAPKGDITKEETETSWDHCDVARKWLGLPRRNPPSGGACEVEVSWTNDPARTRWVVDHRVPHWRSKEWPSLVGSDKYGIDCPVHGKHPAQEMICFTWIKHNSQCPLAAVVAPKDLLSPLNSHLQPPKK